MTFTSGDRVRLTAKEQRHWSKKHFKGGTIRSGRKVQYGPYDVPRYRVQWDHLSSTREELEDRLEKC